MQVRMKEDNNVLVGVEEEEEEEENGWKKFLKYLNLTFREEFTHADKTSKFSRNLLLD